MLVAKSKRAKPTELTVPRIQTRIISEQPSPDTVSLSTMVCLSFVPVYLDKTGNKIFHKSRDKILTQVILESWPGSLTYIKHLEFRVLVHLSSSSRFADEKENWPLRRTFPLLAVDFLWYYPVHTNLVWFSTCFMIRNVLEFILLVSLNPVCPSNVLQVRRQISIQVAQNLKWGTWFIFLGSPWQLIRITDMGWTKRGLVCVSG